MTELKTNLDLPIAPVVPRCRRVDGTVNQAGDDPNAATSPRFHAIYMN
jgi:hypothetical protein